MNSIFEQLKQKWEQEQTYKKSDVHLDDLTIFEEQNNILFPNDLTEYFKLFNGSKDYDGDFFLFYPLNEIKSQAEIAKEWNKPVKPENEELYNNIYVFAEYCIHIYEYSIKLSNNPSIINDIFVICGDNYKKIANSFSEFIQLYIEDSPKLYL
jgi:hypothetical protein